MIDIHERPDRSERVAFVLIRAKELSEELRSTVNELTSLLRSELDTCEENTESEEQRSVD